MNKLNDDSIYHIIDYIETFTDFKNMRILNKFYYNLVTDYWKKYKSDKNNVYFTTTCVNISKCVNCKRYGNNYHQIYLEFYPLPRPIYVVCNNWRCIHNCISHKLLHAYENNFVYLNKNNNFLKESIIPRSNNEKTIAQIENRFVLFRNNNVYIKTDWIDKKGDAYDKYVTNEYFNFKIRISSWYKDINIDDSELKLNDIKNCEN
jgi:hypothetical protein